MRGFRPCGKIFWCASRPSATQTMDALYLANRDSTVRLVVRSGIVSPASLLVSIITLAGAFLILHWHAHLLYYGDRPLPYRIASDSDAYIKIASGHLAEVESPFSKRILYPYLVGTVARAFMLANFLCLGLLAYCLAACLEKIAAQPFLALIPLFTAFGFESLSLAYLPDLFHAAFTCLFFLLLLKEQRAWALITLFFLCLARDNTFFLCLILAVIAWLRGERYLFKGALTVLVVGIIVSSVMARDGKPNIHHLPDFLYLALKVPYNFFANIFGVFFWTNVRPDVGKPLFIQPIPAFFRHFAQDSQIGLVLDWRQPFNTLMVLLTIFGTGPLFLFVFRRKWRGISLSLPVQLALVYGVLSYFLGVMLGNWVFRLVGYGWPAFWIALPFLLVRTGFRPPWWKALLLLACFWTVSWMPSLMQESSRHWTLIPPVVIGLSIITAVCLLRESRDFDQAKINN
jgi:hypothetical protein